MRRRIIYSVILSMLIILVSVGIISYINVTESTNRSIQKRLSLANIIGKYINYILETNLTRLYDISNSGSINFSDGNWAPEEKALRSAYEYSIFTDRIFLLDMYGNMMLSYPYKRDEHLNLLSIPYIGKTISEGKPVISDVYTVEPTMKKVIFALVPLRSKDGVLIGVAGGEINPTNYIFSQILKSMPDTKSTVIELLDSHGIVIASNDTSRILTMSDHDKFLGNLIMEKKPFVGTCHRCHNEKPGGKTKDLLALAPLETAPWAVTLREPEEVVFALPLQLRKGFLILSIVSIFTALLLGIGLSRSILNPVEALIKATKKMGKGVLSEPIEISGMDEIGILARSFDTMRIRLAESLESIKQHTLALEERVNERTKDLNRSREKLSSLLKKIITAQEEERKRIARELHDETSQSLSALLLTLDLLKMSCKHDDPELMKKLDQCRDQAIMVLSGVSAMIKDLRPPVLDDFGLEYAIRWVLEKHLGEKKIKFHFETINKAHGTERDLGWMLDYSKIELILFRVIQEAIINISKHAGASNVSVTLTFNKSSIEVDIIDDGKGFDPETLVDSPYAEGDSGFGIIGMKERITLIDGELNISSRPGEGTCIHVSVPY